MSTGVPKPASRWFVRALVVLTVLLCLGTAGYMGQVWWAKRVAEDNCLLKSFFLYGKFLGRCPPPFWERGDKAPSYYFEWWRSDPWYGSWETTSTTKNGVPVIQRHWIPRRTHYEVLKNETGLDFGNDPDAWEAWFKAHPNLVWDDKRKRLVEGPPIPD